MPRAMAQRGSFLADIAQADQAEGLAADLIAFEGFLVPFFSFHGGGGFIEGARQHEHVADGEFRHRSGIGKRGVHHRNALGLGILVVNGIEPSAAAHDHLQVGANIDQRLPDLGPRANDHSIIGGQDGHQFFRRNIVTHIHGQSRGAHLLDIFLFGFITNQDFHWNFSLLEQKLITETYPAQSRLSPCLESEINHKIILPMAKPLSTT